MERLLNVIIELVTDSPPGSIEQLTRSIRKLAAARDAKSLMTWAPNPRAKTKLAEVLVAWHSTEIPPAELASMLVGASAAYHRARSEQEVELVWTGPSSNLVATRKTEQALLQVIDCASERLFITSFVAYNVASILKALDDALRRGVRVSLLLEASDKHGGGVSIDAIGKMKSSLPAAKVLSWAVKSEGFSGGKVHAKVAVADYKICFVSSANLTSHAMEKNMEVGVLIKGGATPRNLHLHLEALETTHVVARA